MSTGSLTLPSLLAIIITESGLSKTQFAHEVGITKSALSHLLSGQAGYTLGPQACLVIAKKFARPPSELLRAAGWDVLASLIEELYGLAAARRAHFVAGRRLSPIDERRIARLRALHPRHLRVLDELIGWRLSQDAADRQEPAKPKRTTTSTRRSRKE